MGETSGDKSSGEETSEDKSSEVETNGDQRTRRGETKRDKGLEGWDQ